MDACVGIDFGGTSVKMGLVDREGRILARESFSTSGMEGVAPWLDALDGALQRLGLDPRRPAVAGMGVGVPGFVDFDRGFIHDLTNVRGWTGVELRRVMTDRYRVPCVVDNDANVMALGECRFGAGRRFRYAVFVTLGTGVGGGLVLDGRVYRGAFSMAGEIGHLSIDRHGIASPQGRGGLEQYVGNRRFVEQTRRLMESGRATTLTERCGGDLERLSPRIIAEAAQAGDAFSLERFDDMADCLATAFASLTYVVQPEIFIVGGGVAQAGAILFEPLRRHLKERLSPHFAERVQVCAAELGNDAGFIGAACLAL